MTFAEVDRAIHSYNRVKKAEMQLQASYDYILAKLVGKSVGMLFNKSINYPDIADAYPTVFNAEELKKQKQEQLDNLSALRFKQFAHSFNARFNGGVKN